MGGFQMGEKVEVLDEPMKGAVQAVEGDRVVIVTDEGFLLEYDSSELIRATRDFNVTNFEAAAVKREKDAPKKKVRQTTRPKERNAPKIEVDLHIHHLVKSTSGMTSLDMLNAQLETAKRQLDHAITKRMQKVVFIHGVGEGVLKEELHFLFKKYGNLKFYDADYRKYGLGATEVHILQNS